MLVAQSVCEHGASSSLSISMLRKSREQSGQSSRIVSVPPEISYLPGRVSNPAVARALLRSPSLIPQSWRLDVLSWTIQGVGLQMQS